MLQISHLYKNYGKFQADDLITKKGNQIWINEKQYRGLKRTVDEKIGSV